MILAMLRLEHPLSWRNGMFPSAPDQCRSIHVGDFAHVVAHIAFARAPKCFDRKDLVLFHFRLVIALDNGHAFTAMNTMLDNVMAIEIANAFDR